MKKCNKCNEIKEECEFYKNKKNKDGLLGCCKACERDRKIKYYADNTESCKQRRKQYVKENYEKIKECKSISYLKYQDKNINKNKEYYESTDKNKYRIYSANRRSAKTSTSDGTINKQYLEDLMEVQNKLCFYCKQDLSVLPSNKIHLDHYVPLSKGGTHSIGNIVWSCASCNFHKHNTIPTKPLIFKLKEIPSKIQ